MSNDPQISFDTPSPLIPCGCRECQRNRDHFRDETTPQHMAFTSRLLNCALRGANRVALSLNRIDAHDIVAVFDVVAAIVFITAAVTLAALVIGGAIAYLSHH